MKYLLAMVAIISATITLDSALEFDVLIVDKTKVVYFSSGSRHGLQGKPVYEISECEI